MTIHILGNGPSLSLFDRSEYPDTDIFVGCNFSDESLRPNYTVLIDVKAINKFRGSQNSRMKLNIPVVISDRANNYIEKKSSGWNTIPSDNINVIDVMPIIRDKSVSKSLAMNSGQHATMYATEKEPEHKEVHLWGMDSFWTENISSDTDKIMRPETAGNPRVKPHIRNHWIKYWNIVFSSRKDNRFFIHCYIDKPILHEMLKNNPNLYMLGH